MKLQFVVNPSPVDNIIRCYLVSAKVTSMHNIVSSKTVKDMLREWGLLRSAAGSLCHVCNRESNIIGRLISGTQTCASCGRAICPQCEVPLGRVHKHSYVACASCYTHRVCPRLLNLQSD